MHLVNIWYFINQCPQFYGGGDLIRLPSPATIASPFCQHPVHCNFRQKSNVDLGKRKHGRSEDRRVRIHSQGYYQLRD